MSSPTGSVTRMCRKSVKRSIPFSLFCGKIPPSGDGDLIRGRLVITEDTVKLYQRLQKGRTKKTPCEEVWSLEVSDIRSLALGKVLGMRKGLILYLDEGSVSFLSGKAVKQKEAIIEALGWDNVPPHPPDCGGFRRCFTGPFTSLIWIRKVLEAEPYTDSDRLKGKSKG